MARKNVCRDSVSLQISKFHFVALLNNAVKSSRLIISNTSTYYIQYWRLIFVGWLNTWVFPKSNLPKPHVSSTKRFVFFPESFVCYKSIKKRSIRRTHLEWTAWRVHGLDGGIKDGCDLSNARRMFCEKVQQRHQLNNTASTSVIVWRVISSAMSC